MCLEKHGDSDHHKDKNMGSHGEANFRPKMEKYFPENIAASLIRLISIKVADHKPANKQIKKTSARVII
jgi:hypothetical protein